MITKQQLTKALVEAWNLGQTYWRQADSESYALQDKSNVTREKFIALVEKTVEILTTTDDLNGLILCDKDPVAYVDESDDGKWGDLVPDIDIKLRTPLYRAWEPK